MNEARMNNSLSTPDDFKRGEKGSFDEHAEPLSVEEIEHAVEELSITDYVKKFREVERRFVDPPLELQRIGLISFVPARGAKPNEKGIYGFAKLRGNFQTEREARERANHLIRYVDSYHRIYHTYVGRPFPLTQSSDFTKEVDKVDLQRETTQAMSDEVKRQRDKEAKEMKEMEERERELLEDTSRTEEEVDPLDKYTELCVKKAQLVWTYAETQKKMDQMKENIIKARQEIKELDVKNPSLRENYFNKYMEARKKAGLSTEQHADNFIKYLVDDIDLGF